LPELIDGRSFTGPIISYVWGQARPVVNAVALAWARELSPEAVWLEVRSATGETEPEPEATREASRGGRFLTRAPADLAPLPPIRTAALWSTVRPEGPREEVSRLTEFLRMPRAVLDAASLASSGGDLPTVVVANCDRVRPYYPGFLADRRVLLDALRDAGLSIVLTLTGEPAPDRLKGYVDASLWVDAESLRSWRQGRLIAERVPDRSLLQVGAPRPLPTLPDVARLLGGLETGS
jgi:hypothetical protein